jgi:hypothetical protein
LVGGASEPRIFEKVENETENCDPLRMWSRRQCLAGLGNAPRILGQAVLVVSGGELCSSSAVFFFFFFFFFVHFIFCAPAPGQKKKKKKKKKKNQQSTINFSLWRFAFRVSLQTTLIITGIVDMAPTILQFGFAVYITHEWRADIVGETVASRVKEEQLLTPKHQNANLKLHKST